MPTDYNNLVKTTHTSHVIQYFLMFTIFCVTTYVTIDKHIISGNLSEDFLYTLASYLCIVCIYLSKMIRKKYTNEIVTRFFDRHYRHTGCCFSERHFYQHLVTLLYETLWTCNFNSKEIFITVQICVGLDIFCHVFTERMIYIINSERRKLDNLLDNVIV